ncbi:MAG TPA: hypothetical protein ENG42_02530 [Candidatus Aenigmarchaeota archaeon]|nr:MAG: hypothetical protein DRP03_03100 [Candidatus Aenigmarchaeota archaeon]HDD46325.1 hypothetical protein [Candidatus Aenigmarchaeota archaeon]
MYTETRLNELYEPQLKGIENEGKSKRPELSKTFKEIFVDTILRAVSGSTDTIITETFQKRKITRFLTDFIYFGFQGGPIDGNQISGIIVRGDEIIGYTTAGVEEPQYVDDLFGFEDGEIRYKDGVLEKLTGTHFDMFFEQSGSADRMFHKDYDKLIDRDSVRLLLMDFASSIYTYFGKRRQLKYRNGKPSEYEFIPLPRSKAIKIKGRTILSVIDPRGYDPLLIQHLTAFTMFYSIADIFYDIGEKAIRSKEDLDIYIKKEIITLMRAYMRMLGKQLILKNYS